MISRFQYPWQRFATMGKSDGNGHLTVPVDTPQNRISLLQMNPICTNIAVKYYSSISKKIDEKLSEGDEEEVRAKLSIEAHRSRQFLFVVATTCLTDFCEKCKLKFISGDFHLDPLTAVPRLDNIEINFVFDNEEPCVLRFDDDCENITFKGLHSNWRARFTNTTEGMLKLLDFVNKKYANLTGRVDLTEV